MFKKSNSNPPVWQPNMCFELEIASPYTNSADYSAFKDTQPPECTPVTDGITVSCNLKAGTTDTLQYKFTDIAASTEGFASLRMNFTNFHTPFSGQTYKTLKVYVYQDADCTQRDPYNRVITVQSVTIKPRNMPSTSVSLETSNKVIAYQGPDNTLSVTFKPES